CRRAPLGHRGDLVNVAEGHATVRRAFYLDAAIMNFQVVNVRLELASGDVQDLLPQPFSRHFHRHPHTAHDVAAGTEGSDWRDIGIARQDADLVESNA